MLQSSFSVICLHFLFICFPLVTYAQQDCERFEWKCKNGECIASDELCDGRKDCRDGSDELAESCIHIRCPNFSFRCAYGACVNGNAECNGIQDCVDNSDETSIMCPGVLQSFSVNGNCSEENFQCVSGQCIALDNACDGKPDCNDASDETVKLCSTAFCPSFAFRCGYGACVNGDAKCDGMRDCYDGSDEAPTLCGERHTTEDPNIIIVNTRPTPPVTYKPPTEVTRPSGCYVADLPNVIFTYESNTNEYLRPGQYVSDSVSIAYRCRSRHVLEGSKTNLCIGGDWISDHPTCSKYCSNLVIMGVTIQSTCEYQKSRISCNQPLRPGTRATISCQIGYQKPDRVLQEYLVCGDSGEWDYHPFRCEQVCGVEPPQATPFIIGGEKINNTLVPWHVGIYSSRTSGRYQQICGGTIINAKVIVSAAHCFWDVSHERPYDKSYYAVGAGKYYRDYYAEEPLPVQLLNVAELHVPPGYQDVILSYQNDIAVLILDKFIEFKPYIKPICIEWQSYSNKSVKSNQLGRVAGWGKVITYQPSEELRVAQLPTISYEDCIEKTEPQYRTLVTGDKFCVGSLNGESVCEGDSGGGFVISKTVGGAKRFFLWGIVSNGLNVKGSCEGNFFTAFTNIQYHSSMIIEFETRYRPK